MDEIEAEARAAAKTGNRAELVSRDVPDPDYALFRSLDGKSWRQLREVAYLALRELRGTEAEDEAPGTVSRLLPAIEKVLDEGPQNPWSRRDG